MTYEEMAEEYYYKTYPVTLNIGEEERKREVTDIFFAGLKAGRPQWHDLRKDPDDLPDEGTYSVVWQNARGYKEIMQMNYEEDDEEKLHWVDGEQECWDDNIIAWCEIPTFDKELKNNNARIKLNR